MWLTNRLGRKKATGICFIIVGIAGITGGVLQTLDAEYKEILTTVLAITANASIMAAWGTVQTMTVELYPTVIRNIGIGMLSFVGAIGSVIGPQLVYLNAYVPGLLLYLCGGISVLCVIGTSLLPETKDKYLLDKIHHNALVSTVSKNDISEVPEVIEGETSSEITHL
ncbi:solute carrier family 22 member 6-like isoform X2 [Mercenaria mercenaria]|uniref:solute carrier family 22 member 6-like isoform X2 n=1 Tax=Mercenaria mercenaria TaxID=6596 RepID=UPI00234F609C|nr:solute carrier family 22 member 6-like isoform X2 [Mercenaria mercenaria]